MNARLNLFENPIAGKVIKHFAAAGKAVHDSPLPVGTQHLVTLRASQINGCGFCTDMHSKDAVAAGEDWLRLNLVAAWREATCFTEAERAALELTEQGTRIADGAGGVPDEIWENAAKHYDEEQLAEANAARNAFHEATDEWASAEYRMDVATTLARRCLESMK